LKCCRVSRAIFRSSADRAFFRRGVDGRNGFGDAIVRRVQPRRLHPREALRAASRRPSPKRAAVAAWSEPFFFRSSRLPASVASSRGSASGDARSSSRRCLPRFSLPRASASGASCAGGIEIRQRAVDQIQDLPERLPVRHFVPPHRDIARFVVDGERRLVFRLRLDPKLNESRRRTTAGCCIAARNSLQASFDRRARWRTEKTSAGTDSSSHRMRAAYRTLTSARSQQTSHLTSS
jgi:hypothetical protein